MTDLIPMSYLNEVCFLSLNTDDKKYRMVLKMSQELLRDILGREFFEEIDEQFLEHTLSDDNSTLYEGYIKDYLAWQTYFYYLKFANLDATPTGIRVFDDANSTIADDVKMFSLEKNVLERSNYYKYALLNFLDESQLNDSTKYPLYEKKCKEQMSFAITSISKCDNSMFKVHKNIITNGN